jgi:hypothetical protein
MNRQSSWKQVVVQAAIRAEEEYSNNAYPMGDLYLQVWAKGYFRDPHRPRLKSQSVVYSPRYADEVKARSEMRGDWMDQLVDGIGGIVNALPVLEREAVFVHYKGLRPVLNGYEERFMPVPGNGVEAKFRALRIDPRTGRRRVMRAKQKVQDGAEQAQLVLPCDPDI